ncbi:hypothetical protein J2128_000419 [Methanomicrobium sp. W14]|uniref:hypothetical protein n=1 Tax=Methanomicrobium sp. W14 TaxID=2817839 RepID=UPI001AE824A3|nr:hypothetical protein [Methanomicrobium sp. W14]MBP2132498.1 hypothetical protein [Methanomicrobium sp. W14]
MSGLSSSIPESRESRPEGRGEEFGGPESVGGRGRTDSLFSEYLLYSMKIYS